MQIKERNLLNTCVRTFCSAGTKIPRHLLQKKLTQQWQTQPWWIKTMMNISLAKDHLWFSSLLQSYPASPPGPGAGDPEDISPTTRRRGSPTTRRRGAPTTRRRRSQWGLQDTSPTPTLPLQQISHTYEYELRTPGFKVKSSPSWNSLNGAVGVGLNQMNPR